ncbi:MAG: dicarboxylate/amino acid:cation symporter [Lachnospiraceae bacterium]|nr:dicarboxylate/amino acid:cation symporter [Lachnospiraceae bacterium]
MRYKEEVTADGAGVEKITGLVRQLLLKNSVKDKDIEKAVLAAEEAAEGLLGHASADARITIFVRSFFGRVMVVLRSKGEKYDPVPAGKIDHLIDDESDEMVQETIRGILLKSVASDFKYLHAGGINWISFTIIKSPRAQLYRTLGAMGLAIVVGLILSMVVETDIDDIINDYLLIPVYTVYLNALKMVVAPVVFFSIATCIMQFSDLSELGRIGGRAITIFMFTTLIATMVGIGVFYLFRPGTPMTSIMDTNSVQKITSQTLNISIKDLIVNIVPSDFVEPFVSSNMLQLIFLAVLCGIVTGRMGQYMQTVRNAFEAFNDLFLKMAMVVIGFMPVAVFCSISSMVLKVGISAIISVLGIFATFLAGLLCMITVYCLILAVGARVNPIWFLKNYIPTMTQVFSIASSNASIPVNMEACKRMGVPKKIYSLTIPLGATLNMDGGCVYMSVFALALAKAYGIEVSGASIVAMVVSIIVMSVGAPGIPGSGLICISVLLTQMGVPAEAVGLIMGIDAFVGMFRCMSNCTGDVVTSILVARKENLLDMDKYRAGGGSDL